MRYRWWLAGLWLITIAPDGARAAEALDDQPAQRALPSGLGLKLSEAVGVPEDAVLENDGAIIGRIEVRVQDIFDPEVDGDRALYRLGNSLHIRTRESVIRDQLLFHSGERYSARVLAESERLLRENHYVGEARIHPIRYADHRVDIEVVTRDTWTLSPKVSFGRRGGANTSSFGIEDKNLLGFGSSIKLVQRYGVDRDESQLSFIDPQLFGTHLRLSTTVSENSDGYSRQLGLERPFYALDSRWSVGVDALDEDRVDPLYAFGEIAEQFRHRETGFELRAGWSDGLVDGMTRRWSAGFTYQRDLFSADNELPAPGILPADRMLAYPWIAFDLIEDSYATTSNHDTMGRTEDMHLGRRLGLRLGFADGLFGADRSAAIFEATAGIGFEPQPGQILLLSSEAQGRWESKGLADATAGLSMRYYVPDFGKHLFYASAEGRVARRLDVDHQLLLGGDSGLRGYPLRYQSGDRSWLVTLEQRFFSDWYPWRIAHVGGAVFFDAGRVSGSDALGGATSGLLRDVGFGLRLSSSRSGLGSVLHIDLAFPLDGDQSIDSVQLLIQTKRSF